MERTLNLVNSYFIPHLQRAHGKAAIPEDELDASALARAILDRGALERILEIQAE